MKTIKVIDFLIKKANKEKLPKKVKFHNEIFVASDEYYREHINQEEDSDGSQRRLFEGWVLGKILNDLVEIIEEDKEIELIPIEEFNISYNLGFVDYKNVEKLKDYLNKDFQTIYDTLDLLIKNQRKLIEVVNELKKGK